MDSVLLIQKIKSFFIIISLLTTKAQIGFHLLALALPKPKHQGIMFQSPQQDFYCFLHGKLLQKGEKFTNKVLFILIKVKLLLPAHAIPPQSDGAKLRPVESFR